MRFTRPLLLGLALVLCPNAGSAQTLSPEQRVEGVSRIWMEAHYNFVYFDQVPALDWDTAYRDALGRVLNAEDDLDYYKELERFMAKLRDGHSDVTYPSELWSRLGRSALAIRVVAGRPHMPPRDGGVRAAGHLTTVHRRRLSAR